MPYPLINIWHIELRPLHAAYPSMNTPYYTSHKMFTDLVNFSDMAPLPTVDQIYPWLRYQIEEYNKGIRHSYEQRLETIWSRPVNRVYVLDFERLTPRDKAGSGSKIKDGVFWRGAAGVREMSDTEMGLDVADTLCFQLGGQEMVKAGFGAYWDGSNRLIPDKGDLRDYWIEISFDRDFLGLARSYGDICTSSLGGRSRDSSTSTGTSTTSTRTMSQRIERVEEEMHDLRRDVVGLRGVVESFTTKQSRVSTWLITCMTQLMDASGLTYQAFDSTLVGSSRMPY
ncbi:hypothetical protein Tco_0664632 [Tanacetum coccineum]